MNWQLAIWPDRAQYRPGQQVRLRAEVRGPAGGEADLTVAITERVDRLAKLAAPVALDEHGFTSLELAWTPPAGQGWRAFGADATLVTGPQWLIRSSTAFDVADHWQMAPRYGVLSDFAPNDGGLATAAAAERLLRLHINVVQFYDWMYTHHTYMPPGDPFTDPLGRRLSLAVVREKIAACRERGMSPIAYAAVYGAEQPFAGEHADWLLYDGAGQPLHLGHLFYIQDISPESGWRQHLLGEYRQALSLGFAGFHADTYGSPRSGLARRGDRWERVRLEQHLPGFVAEADALAREKDPEGGAIFNCVGGWPLEVMARAPAAALYVEVWPPNETYRDLYEVIMRARRISPGRQVVMAAYLPTFHRDRERPVGAMAGLRLTVAAIMASGGFHLLPCEGEGVLADPYYPVYGRLEPEAWETLRAYWDFQTRWGPILADPQAVDNTTTHTYGLNREVRFAGPTGVAFTPLAAPGKVWTLLRESPGYWAIHLINLTACENACWTAPQPEPLPVRNIDVRLEILTPVRTVAVASPDWNGGSASSLPYRVEYEPGVGQVLHVTVPEVVCWSMLLVEWEEAPQATGP